jgi:hypothetical protein
VPELILRNPVQHLTVMGVFLRGSDFIIDMMFGNLTPLHGEEGCYKLWLERGFCHGHMSDMQDMCLNYARLCAVGYDGTA